MLTLEEIGEGRAEAARIVGITSADIGNWMTRNNLFATRRRGSGVHMTYRIHEMMQLAAVKRLIAMGFGPQQAVDLVEPIRVYGTMLDYSSGGRLTIGFDGEEWSTRSWSSDNDTISLNLWPLFDEIVECWIGNPPPSDYAEYLGKVNELREAQGCAS